MGQAACRGASEEAVGVIQGNASDVPDSGGEEGKGTSSYEAKSTNYMVLAFKEKTVLAEKTFSPLIHPSLMRPEGSLGVIEFNLLWQEVQWFSIWV